VYSGYDYIPDSITGKRNLLGDFGPNGLKTTPFGTFPKDSSKRRGAAIISVVAPPQSRKSLECGP